ncbi:hypothetical protein TSUD_189010 [Trifolium subterraneum]|uniref:Uncharacterized protein n=1 Tax=Trifolium subterraneum TaxID=3900 RepID=A0A2Z6PS66_TRISU|nr:hypothetical protein TSUD_189010 [Trifolium subterraneum]
MHQKEEDKAKHSHPEILRLHRAYAAAMPTYNQRSQPQQALQFLLFKESFTKREITAISICTIIKVEWDLPDGLVSSVYNKERTATSNINHIKVIRKFSFFTWSINMAPSAAPFSSSNCRDP